MDWTTTGAVVGAMLTNIAVVAAMWWQLDSKIERRLDKIESTLLTLMHDVGELKGKSHTHPPAT